MTDLRLLIADDENELVENIVYDLGSLFKHIETASNGKEALSILKSNKIDCVLSDIKMGS